MDRLSDMSETVSLGPATPRRFLYSFCVIVACLTMNAVLNLSEIVFHSFFAQKSEKWLALSHEITYLVGEFVPAVFYVGRHMTMKGYYSRMEFVENVISMNFLISIIYAILITAVGTIEIIKYRDKVNGIVNIGLQAARRYRGGDDFMNKNALTMSVASVCFFIFLCAMMSSGLMFGSSLFPFYIWDFEIAFISIIFAFIQVFYFWLMVLLASVILSLIAARQDSDSATRRSRG
jgi:hypothetical protein